jgi:enoyl-[acyl-carrier protein] reductase I
MLKGKRLLVTGVATSGSIAYASAVRALDLGAEVIATAYPRELDNVRELLGALDVSVPVLPLDLTDPEQVAAVAAELGERYDRIDGALHAVAFAPRAALHGTMADAEPGAVELAFRTSAWSFSSLASILTAVGTGPDGGSLVGLDFDADDRAWATYNWMGVCKAALRSTSRYLARDLGRAGIRVNLVAAGPLRTRAASGIPGFHYLTEAWERSAPLPWDPENPEPVADVVCFLLSDMARVITGEIIHADAGFHAMAGRHHPLDEEAK